MNNDVSKSPGIYIATIKSKTPMPVTRDTRYVNTCAKVNNKNVKVGKASNLHSRRNNYWKDFDQDNVIFTPVALLTETALAERMIMKALAQYRMRSPKGRKTEWLEGISVREARKVVLTVLKTSDISYQLNNDSPKGMVLSQGPVQGNKPHAVERYVPTESQPSRKDQMTKKTKADYGGIYQIARIPRSMKPHNAESWSKLEALASSAANGKMNFAQMAKAVEGHKSGTGTASDAPQFVTYCIRSGWLRRTE
jgi:hypothetical protein